MKILNIFLCCYFVMVYSNNIPKISQEDSKILEMDELDKECKKYEDEIFFELYSKKIAEMDLETLKKNPELVLRKAFAEFGVLFSTKSFEEFINQLPNLQKDYKFVMDNSEKNSKIFINADLKYKFADFIKKKSPKNVESFLGKAVEFYESILEDLEKKVSEKSKDLKNDIQDLRDISNIIIVTDIMHLEHLMNKKKK
ncbi:MAG: hypothetical protein AMS24_03050 [Chlamydiae bacterium SM23_39]|nr:MAG: hypothetical protein AMS24_03050 [Chlamydiae bacterium SM23_39]